MKKIMYVIIVVALAAYLMFTTAMYLANMDSMNLFREINYAFGDYGEAIAYDINDLFNIVGIGIGIWGLTAIRAFFKKKES